ncbi:hypothetical protein [Neomoorella humiferrea]|nr:hypothetical protein [Moorella humiferrea]
MKEAWEEEEALDAGEKDLLHVLSGHFKKLLIAKEYLRTIRVPAYLLN